MDEFTDLDADELRRRCRNQKAWMKAYASSLDGIPAISNLPGSGGDSCRMPDEIRRVVSTLVRVSPFTWEHDCFPSRKDPGPPFVANVQPEDSNEA